MHLLTLSALATSFLAVFAAANPVEMEKKDADPGYYAEEYYRRPAEYYRPAAAPGAGIGIGANADAAADAHLGLGVGL